MRIVRRQLGLVRVRLEIVWVYFSRWLSMLYMALQVGLLMIMLTFSSSLQL